MSLYVASLNSGSNGNCYYIGNDNEAVLIDAGISCRETEKRMKRLGLEMRRVKAVFISHEHADHIHGLPVLSKKFNLPVYGTAQTLECVKDRIRPDLLYYISSFAPVNIGKIAVTAFPKHHDAADPQSFVLTCEGVTTGVFTDIGRPCEHVRQYFSLCHAVFLESNYDEEMLEKGRYPFHLKNRIRGGKGHLSNREARQLFIEHRAPFLSYLFLAHLSEENNSPAIAQNIFSRAAKHTRVVVASRDRESGLYHITSGGSREKRTLVSSALNHDQLTLF